MSFSFGNSSTAAPAPSVGGFGGFGNTGAASTPAGGFGFGSASTPAPAAGGSAFGGFGGTSTPAPASGGGFGSTPGFGAAPASSGFGGFGSTASAPGGFGAPASGAGGFGSPSPAPGGFGGFGSSGFGSSFGGAPASGYGAPQQQQQQQQQHPTFVSPKTFYKDLPPNYRQCIDRVTNAMTNHRRTMANVSGLGPAPLVEQEDARGVNTAPLQKDIEEVKMEMETTILPRLGELLQKVNTLRDELVHVWEITHVFGVWPTEATAARRGVRLSKFNEEKKEDAVLELRAALDKHSVNVDRIERFPSPFFWLALRDMRGRLDHLRDIAEQIQNQNNQENWDGMPVTYLIEQQDEKLFIIRRRLHELNFQMDQIRAQYAQIEKQNNVLYEADLKEAEHNRKMIEEYRRHTFLAQPTNSTTGTGTSGAPAPAPGNSSAFSFGPSPAPSSGAFSFSGSTPAPAPSSGFGGFGQTPAPAAPTPAFGATPAPATPAPTAGGFGFGSTPAPATSTFGAPSPAPFSSSSTPRKKTGGSRSGRRK